MRLAAMDRTDTRTVYGVDLVSSFYGPGIWGAWLLVVLSTFLDKIFQVQRENQTEESHILGVDLNLASAFAYPINAAIDIRAHSHHHFNDDAVSQRDVASVDAALIVLLEGMCIGAFLSLIRVVRIRPGVFPKQRSSLASLGSSCWSSTRSSSCDTADLELGRMSTLFS